MFADLVHAALLLEVPQVHGGRHATAHSQEGALMQVLAPFVCRWC